MAMPPGRAVRDGARPASIDGYGVAAHAIVQTLSTAMICTSLWWAADDIDPWTGGLNVVRSGDR